MSAKWTWSCFPNRTWFFFPGGVPPHSFPHSSSLQDLFYLSKLCATHRTRIYNPVIVTWLSQPGAPPRSILNTVLSRNLPNSHQQVSPTPSVPLLTPSALCFLSLKHPSISLQGCILSLCAIWPGIWCRCSRWICWTTDQRLVGTWHIFWDGLWLMLSVQVNLTLRYWLFLRQCKIVERTNRCLN